MTISNKADGSKRSSGEEWLCDERILVLQNEKDGPGTVSVLRSYTHMLYVRIIYVYRSHTITMIPSACIRTYVCTYTRS